MTSTVCGVYLACVYSVGAVRQSSGMRLDDPVGVGIAWNRLGSLVLLGCTALMRANSPKHPSGCLQFAQIGEWRKGLVYSLIFDESEGVVLAALMHEFATMGQQLARSDMYTTALRLTCLSLAFFLQHFVSTPSPISTRPGLARD